MNDLKIYFAIIDEFYLILNGNSLKENTLFSIYGANVFEKRVKKIYLKTAFPYIIAKALSKKKPFLF